VNKQLQKRIEEENRLSKEVHDRQQEYLDSLSENERNAVLRRDNEMLERLDKEELKEQKRIAKYRKGKSWL
jgi:hypothetical protein